MSDLIKVTVIEIALEGDVEELLHDLAEALAEPQDAVHSHKCGYPGGGGCDFVFEHANLCAGSDVAHMCPACGRGPWSYIWRNPA